eukprot:m.132959 g.132959  ORF g.132959 m.132959 type:complete len:2404 (+) comp16869_c0_seq3:193-7404(+)
MANAAAKPPPQGHGDEDLAQAGFPTKLMASLDAVINIVQWNVPIRQDQALAVCTRAATSLIRAGRGDDPDLQKYLKTSLPNAYGKLLTDRAVTGWQPSVHTQVRDLLALLCELIVVCLDPDSGQTPLLGLMRLLFSPNTLFHDHNERQPSLSDAVVVGPDGSEGEQFATIGPAHAPHGWLVDIYNQFGELGGFDFLVEYIRRQGGEELVPWHLACLVGPFGDGAFLLTPSCCTKYFEPLRVMTLEFLSGLQGESLKKHTKNLAQNDALSCICSGFKNLSFRYRPVAEASREFDSLLLSTILKLLQGESYNGVMYALNEMRSLINDVSKLVDPRFPGHRHADEWLTKERLADWMDQNNLVDVVLKNNLHQQQYVSKLIFMFQFLMREQRLTREHLSAIWQAQIGKHDVIVTNVQDLLAKLAYLFDTEQLDHLFDCFQESWKSAVSNSKQMQKLLVFVQLLAEDDNEGKMASKVLRLLWILAHDADTPRDIVEVAVTSLVKILDMGYIGDGDSQRMVWMDHCAKDITQHKWIVPAMKMIRAIADLFKEAKNRNYPGKLRHKVLQDLDKSHSLKANVVRELRRYCRDANKFFRKQPESDPEVVVVEGNYTHADTIDEILRFLKYIVWDGHLWLDMQEGLDVWQLLVEQAPCPKDRETGFTWFINAMGRQPDLENESQLKIFKDKVLKVNPVQLSAQGFECFRCFFQHCNNPQQPAEGPPTPVPNPSVGLDYLWSISLQHPDAEIAASAIGLLKETSITSANAADCDPQERHSGFISECMKALSEAHFKLTRSTKLSEKQRLPLLRCIERCLQLLAHYVVDCDNRHPARRSLVPHGGAFVGEPLRLTLRSWNGRSTFPADLHGHVTTAKLRLFAARQFRAAPTRIGLFLLRPDGSPSQCLTPATDHLMLVDNNVCDQSTVRVKVLAEAAKLGPHPSEFPPQPATENLLPGVMCSLRPDIVGRLFELAQIRGSDSIQRHARQLLAKLPSDPETLQCLLAAKTQAEFASAIRTRVLPGDGGDNSGSSGGGGTAGASGGGPSDGLGEGASVFRLLYNLECLAELITPASEDVDPSQTAAFARRFLEANGLANLLTILQQPIPTLDPQSLDLDDRRAVMTMCVRLVTSLLVSLDNPAAARPTAAAVAGPAPGAGLSTPPGESSAAGAGSSVPSPGDAADEEQDDGPWPSGVGPEDLAHALLALVWRSGTGRFALGSDVKLADAVATPATLCHEDEKIAIEGMRLLARVLTQQASARKAVIFSMPELSVFLEHVLLQCTSDTLRAVCSTSLAALAERSAVRDRLWAICDEGLLAKAEAHPASCLELLDFACTLAHGALSQNLPRAEQLLDTQVAWIVEFEKRAAGNYVEQAQLLTGQLRLCATLVSLLPSRKPELGPSLLPLLFNRFLYPSSQLMLALRQQADESQPIPQTVVPCCSDSLSKMAATELIVELAGGCEPVLTLAVETIAALFFQPEDKLETWDTLPQIAPRSGDYVGLKNPCATCYMNSVIQQLFMQPTVREFVTQVKETVEEVPEERDNSVLFQIQSAFAHLLDSEMQFFAPEGFWKAYRHYGEPVDVREQQDAREFFDNLVDQLDEKFKAAKNPMVLSRVFGGVFADQKIIQSGCTHRYEKDDPFTTVAIDIRNQSNLQESLAQYVKGELLDGSDAYKCEACDAKRPCVKRVSFKTLPRVLVIHLKRFDFDWDRGIPIKFNDLFQFPNDLDMAPYTVEGVTAQDSKGEGAAPRLRKCMYRLAGVLVHSGQASGGHYYSFVRKPGGTAGEWLKFDDTDVTEINLDEGAMSREWFGGEYVASEWDAHFKRYTPQTRERWWNAFMLFYERVDPPPLTLEGDLTPEPSLLMTPEEAAAEDAKEAATAEALAAFTAASVSSKTTAGALDIPSSIQRAVKQENLLFQHRCSLFSSELRLFVQNLCRACVPYLQKSPAKNNTPDLGLPSLQLAIRFLTVYVMRTDRTVRGQMVPWTHLVQQLLTHSPSALVWLAKELAGNPAVVKEHLMDCPAADARMFFHRTIFATLRNLLRVLGAEEGMKAAEQVWDSVLPLLDLASATWKQLGNIFRLVHEFARIGAVQRRFLVERGVLQHLMRIFINAEPSSGKTQQLDFSNLHVAVSLLARSLDLSAHEDKRQGEPVQHVDNAYRELRFDGEANGAADPLVAPPAADVAMLLQEDQVNNYICEAIFDSADNEAVQQLVAYLCWQRGNFSARIILFILERINSQPAFEHRPLFKMLEAIFGIADTLQSARISYAAQNQGTMSLCTIMENNQHRYPRRTYTVFKFIVNLCQSTLEPAKKVFCAESVRSRWSWGATWLYKQLQKPMYSQYEATQPGVSNEGSTGYAFERSDSAHDLLRLVQPMLPQQLAVNAAVLSENPDDYTDPNDMAFSDDSDDDGDSSMSVAT